MSAHASFQLDAHARLSADSYFSDIEVSLVRPKAKLGFAQIYEQIDAALGGTRKKSGKTGAAIQVLMPVSDGQDPNVSGARLTVTLTVRIQEITEINLGPVGTGKTCEDIAERVIQVLHHFGAGYGGVLVFAGLQPTDAFDPRVTLDVNFRIETGLASLPKVAAPTISATQTAAPATVTLACTTPDAAITYSLDGSYPTTAYTAPFLVSTAATIRTAATATGFQQSNVNQLTLT